MFLVSVTLNLIKCSSLHKKQALNSQANGVLKSPIKKKTEEGRTSTFLHLLLLPSCWNLHPLSVSPHLFLLATLFQNTLWSNSEAFCLPFWFHVFLLLSFCLCRCVSISCLKTSIPSWPWEASFMALDCMHILYCSGVSSSRHCFSCHRWKRPLTGVRITMRLLWRYLRYRCTSSPPQPLMSRSKPPDTNKIQNKTRNIY